MSFLRIVAFTPADVWLAVKAMTALEIVAVLFTLANVWLMVKENIWGWPAGIISVILYTIVNYEAKLYANTGLQIVYLALNIHGWYEWLHGGENRTERRIAWTTRRQWLWCVLACFVLTGALLLLLRWTTDEVFPFWDASTTAVSLVGQWMMNTKLIENWILWLLVDLVYVPIYFSRSLPLTACLYAFFCVLAWRGWVEWKRSIEPVSASA